VSPPSRTLCSDLPCLLRLGAERRKKQTENENDREPDPPHGHLGGGWLPGSLAERHDAHQQSAYAGRFQRDEEQASEAVSQGRGFAGQHALLDHLVRSQQQRLPDREAERRRFGVLDVVGLSTRLLRYFG
jgi:hypothetical protein